MDRQQLTKCDYMLRWGVWSASLLPPPVLSCLGRCLGRGLLKLDRKHQRIAHENLRLSFPEKDEAWVRETALANLEHLGQVATELSLLYRLSPQKILDRTRHHGVENYKEAAAQGKGCLFLTGHLGNWEWASLASAVAVATGTIVARPLDWPPADRLVHYIRTRTGHDMVPRERSARQLLRSLRANRNAVALLDQNVDWYEGEWVDFFGRPACTNKGLALLAYATETPVITYHNFRAPDGVFDVYFSKPLPLIKTGDKSADIWANTQNYTKALEDIIRQRPDQWFWLHQRWKSKPYLPWPRDGK